jgi:hypothetical protein
MPAFASKSRINPALDDVLHFDGPLFVEADADAMGT